jgi:hypothetical protein
MSWTGECVWCRVLVWCRLLEWCRVLKKTVDIAYWIVVNWNDVAYWMVQCVWCWKWNVVTSSEWPHVELDDNFTKIWSDETFCLEEHCHSVQKDLVSAIYKPPKRGTLVERMSFRVYCSLNRGLWDTASGTTRTGSTVNASTVLQSLVFVFLSSAGMHAWSCPDQDVGLIISSIITDDKFKFLFWFNLCALKINIGSPSTMLYSASTVLYSNKC